MFSTILSKYSSVDTRFGTDKITSHSYGDIYNKLFSERKDSCKKILEIGISGGFGLKVYSEYFTNADIYGIDINDSIVADIKNNNNIHLCFGDAKDNLIINTFPYEYDIILEDASHDSVDQIQHFKDYSKFVKPGGIYIIEDVHQDAMNSVFSETSQYATQNGFTVELIDLRYIKNRFDDILIVFKKTR
jgi:predicted O-methyltransferase YrrM